MKNEPTTPCTDVTVPADARPEIKLHIERLVFERFSLTRAEGALLRSALESELANLLRQQPFEISNLKSQTPTNLPSIEISNLKFQTSRPRAIAQQTARALYQAVRHAISSDATFPQSPPGAIKLPK